MRDPYFHGLRGRLADDVVRLLGFDIRELRYRERRSPKGHLLQRARWDVQHRHKHARGELARDGDSLPDYLEDSEGDAKAILGLPDPLALGCPRNLLLEGGNLLGR